MSVLSYLSVMSKVAGCVYSVVVVPVSLYCTATLGFAVKHLLFVRRSLFANFIFDCIPTVYCYMRVLKVNDRNCGSPIF